MIQFSSNDKLSTISKPNKLHDSRIKLETDQKKCSKMPIKNKIISIVDDELSTTNLFYTALRTIKGIDVFGSTDPVQALEHLKMNKSDYAVMICDLSMPVINGLQLLHTVKDINPLSRTILITAYDIDGSLLQEYTKKEIIDCFLQKPISIDQLRSEISKQISFA